MAKCLSKTIGPLVVEVQFGSGVGEDEGATDGRPDGSVERTRDGASLGVIDGTRLGKSEGMLDGLVVGRETASVLGVLVEVGVVSCCCRRDGIAWDRKLVGLLMM